MSVTRAGHNLSLNPQLTVTSKLIELCPKAVHDIFSCREVLDIVGKQNQEMTELHLGPVFISVEEWNKAHFFKYSCKVLVSYLSVSFFSALYYSTTFSRQKM